MNLSMQSQYIHQLAGGRVSNISRTSRSSVSYNKAGGDRQGKMKVARVLHIGPEHIAQDNFQQIAKTRDHALPAPLEMIIRHYGKEQSAGKEDEASLRLSPDQSTPATLPGRGPPIEMFPSLTYPDG